MGQRKLAHSARPGTDGIDSGINRHRPTAKYKLTWCNRWTKLDIAVSKVNQAKGR